MRNAYTQVALTYLRRPLATWQGIVISAIPLFMLPMAALTLRDLGNKTRSSAALILVVMPFIYLFMAVSVHLKDQFADSRARLTPGYRRAHVVVGIAAILFSAVLLPAALGWIAGSRSVGPAAIGVLAFGSVFWTIVFNSPWFGLFPLLGILAVMAEPARVILGEYLSGRHEAWAVVTLLTGVAVCCGAIGRLIRLTDDESQRYRRIHFFPNDDAIAAGQAIWSEKSLTQRWRTWVADQEAEALTRHARRASVSRWSRVCRWQVGAATPWGIGSICVFFFLYAIGLTWLVPEFAAVGKEGFFGFAMMLVLVPSSVLFGQVHTRQKQMERELLLPVTRRDYVRQLGVAVAASCFRLWLGVAAALLLSLAIVSPHSVLSSMVLHMIFFSGMAQVFAIGVMVWAATLGSRASGFAVFIVAIMAVTIVAGMCQGSRGSGDYLIQAGVILAGIGLLFAWCGHGRWMTLDLA